MRSILRSFTVFLCTVAFLLCTDHSFGIEIRSQRRGIPRGLRELQRRVSPEQTGDAESGFLVGAGIADVTGPVVDIGVCCPSVFFGFGILSLFP